MYKRKITFISLLLLIGTQLQASPIHIFGVDWSMSKNDMRIVFQNRGYECGDFKQNDEVGNEEDIVFCWQGEYQSHTEKTIKIRPNKLVFNCNVFNGCEFSTEQIGQNMTKQRIIRELAPEVQYTQDNDTIVNYCGTGVDGDVLCIESLWHNVISGVLGKRVPFITLDRGTYKSDLSFD